MKKRKLKRRRKISKLLSNRTKFITSSEIELDNFYAICDVTEPERWGALFIKDESFLKKMKDGIYLKYVYSNIGEYLRGLYPYEYQIKEGLDLLNVQDIIK